MSRRSLAIVVMYGLIIASGFPFIKALGKKWFLEKKYSLYFYEAEGERYCIEEYAVLWEEGRVRREVEIARVINRNLLAPQSLFLRRNQTAGVQLLGASLLGEVLLLNFNSRLAQLSRTEEERLRSGLLLNIKTNFKEIKLVKFLMAGLELNGLHRENEYRSPFVLGPPSKNLMAPLSGSNKRPSAVAAERCVF